MEWFFIKKSLNGFLILVILYLLISVTPTYAMEIEEQNSYSNTPNSNIEKTHIEYNVNTQSIENTTKNNNTKRQIRNVTSGELECVIASPLALLAIIFLCQYAYIAYVRNYGNLGRRIPYFYSDDYMESRMAGAIMFGVPSLILILDGIRRIMSREK